MCYVVKSLNKNGVVFEKMVTVFLHFCVFGGIQTTFTIKQVTFSMLRCPTADIFVARMTTRVKI